MNILPEFLCKCGQSFKVGFQHHVYPCFVCYTIFMHTTKQWVWSASHVAAMTHHCRCADEVHRCTLLLNKVQLGHRWLPQI